MSVVFISFVPCPICGYRNVVMTFMTVRINKHSLRSIKPGLGFSASSCMECGRPLLMQVRERAALDEESAAKVDAHRARKGWLPLRTPGASLISEPAVDHVAAGTVIP